MIKKTIFIIIITILFFTSCISNKISLKEVDSQKKDSNELLEKDIDIEAVSVKILEVIEEHGEQKYIYIKLGRKNKEIRKGLKGYVYNDLAKTEKIGKFELIEVYYEYSKGKLVELNYKINQDAVAYIEIDPEKLID